MNFWAFVTSRDPTAAMEWATSLVAKRSMHMSFTNSEDIHPQPTILRVSKGFLTSRSHLPPGDDVLVHCIDLVDCGSRVVVFQGVWAVSLS